MIYFAVLWLCLGSLLIMVSPVPILAVAVVIGIDVASLLLWPFGALFSIGMAGLFASAALSHLVICLHCGKKAFVVPDPGEPGNVHQPWRRQCIHCAAALP